MQNEIIKILAETFKVDVSTITPETKSEEINGWDSLGMLTVISEIEGALNISIPIEKIADISTVKDLLDIVENLG